MINNVLLNNQSQSVATSSSAATLGRKQSTGTNFAGQLGTVLSVKKLKTSDNHQSTEGFSKKIFKSGRLSIQLDQKGQPSKIMFHSENGAKLKTSIFSAPEILKNTSKYGIPLTDLRGIAEQLDAHGVGYKPYELYKGTGSDHGIDFENLIDGGLGTAYDWTKDDSVALKGPSAMRRLAENQALANKLNLRIDSHITTEIGIDFTRLSPTKATQLTPSREFVVVNKHMASWYETAQLANEALGSLNNKSNNFISANDFFLKK